MSKSKLYYLTFPGIHINSFLFTQQIYSVMALIGLAVPHLSETEGNVVNVSSIGAQSAYPASTPYVVSKAGLDHLTRNYALLYADQGIRVNTVS